MTRVAGIIGLVFVMLLSAGFGRLDAQSQELSGRVYHDLNLNGDFDASETLMADWRVVLLDSNWNEVAYSTTDQSGRFALPWTELNSFLCVSSVNDWLQLEPTTAHIYQEKSCYLISDDLTESYDFGLALVSEAVEPNPQIIRDGGSTPVDAEKKVPDGGAVLGESTEGEVLAETGFWLAPSIIGLMIILGALGIKNRTIIFRI